MSSRDDRRDDDLEERLDELEDVLSELRRDLRENRAGPPWSASTTPALRTRSVHRAVHHSDGDRAPRNDDQVARTGAGDARLADPGRSLDETGAATDRLGDVWDGASAGLSRSLSELRRTAL